MNDYTQLKIYEQIKETIKELYPKVSNILGLDEAYSDGEWSIVNGSREYKNELR